MSKFYIDSHHGRKYYAYSYRNDEINYFPLTEEETKALLTSLDKNPIKQVNDTDKSIEIIFNNSLTLIIDNLKVFQIHHDHNDHYFQLLLNKLKAFIEKETINQYKKNLPQYYKPRINRTKQKRFPAKQLIAGALSFTIASSLIAGLINKEIEKENDNTLSTSISITLPEKTEVEENIVIEAENNLEADHVINLAFQDRTESNRVSEQMSKLDETKAYLGTYISEYATRYGLPYDLACAQITQERPNIENGVCINPCQITYEYFVGETMTVPIYDENGFTGNYDIFEITKEMLDSPEGNIRVGLAYLRTCVDKFDSLITGLFTYNQGESTLNIACEYYGLDIKDYLGEENGIKARDLINRYYENQNRTHGDSLYLEHVFSYLDLSDRGSTTLEYYLAGEKKTIEINNTLMYNNELKR